MRRNLAEEYVQAIMKRSSELRAVVILPILLLVIKEP
jgi:hypothetical protein